MEAKNCAREGIIAQFISAACGTELYAPLGKSKQLVFDPLYVLTVWAYLRVC